MPLPSRRLRPVRPTRRLWTGIVGTILVAGSIATPGTSSAADPSRGTAAAADSGSAADAGLVPTVHYEDYLRHADDRTAFAPGGRVTVGFTPRAGDRFSVGGAAPRSLPAGRATGRAMRADVSAVPATASPEPTPAATDPLAADPTPTASPTDVPTGTPGAALDAPVVEPGEAIPAVGTAYARPTGDGRLETQAAVSPSGLRKEIFGFLPYWELNDSTVLDYSKLSTIAFFGVGASAAGNLEKTKDGTTTVGWSGWTSSRMTTVINEAHKHHTRVVLTVQSFAWSSAGKTKQAALLGSSTARANLASQIVAAVRDRGADGVNLDFEPLVAGYGDEFTALVRKIRQTFDAVGKGYQITFDTTGYIGNYPLADATAAGGADAVFVMGYDYRNGSSSTAGSIAPLSSSAYDITDTILAYTAKIPASKIILGVPYYGRAWSTATDALNAENISGTKYGASATVIYANALSYLAEHGRRYDAREGVAWTVYKRKNCTDQYGCVTPWRQLYVDDATALKAKYDLVNRYGLRGAGIWALGYDGSRPELWTAIRDKFITDTTPPTAGIKTLATTQSSEAFTVDWTAIDDFGVASFDVDVSIDGRPWARWLTATTSGKATYTGARGHAFAFRVRARDHKGNTNDWSKVPLSATAPKLAVGGFGRVVTDTLNGRSGPGTDQAVLRTLAAGDLVAFLEGPTSAGGYTWYRVAAPLASWPAVSGSRSDLWVATGGGGDAYISAVVPPNSTKVGANAGLAPVDGASWHALAPVRLLDTRTGNGLSGALVDEKVRTFTLAGRGGIPTDAVAVTANLTVTGATSAGYVALGPTMTASPSTSSINVSKGRTIANGLTLRLGGSGTVGAVFGGSSGAKAHAILDVTGYFGAGSGATWYPLKPARVLDTREGLGLSGSFRAGSVRTFAIGGRAGVPSDAVSVTGNLTAVAPTGSGYVSIGPSMTASPTTSTLNLAKGVTIANNVTLRLGSGGKVGAVYKAAAGTRVHLLFDVTGYFRAGSGGAEWHPVAPVRLLDTRVPNGLSGASADAKVRSFALTGRGTIPVDAVAVTANLTITGPTSSGYVAIGPTMTSSPATSNVNVRSGVTLANGVALRIGSGGTVATVFQGASGASTHQVLDVTGYFR